MNMAAICIDRALTIEAEVPGAVVLNATGARRVFYIQSGTAELIGLNITGGYASGVQSARLLNPLQHFLQCPVNQTHACNVPSPHWNTHLCYVPSVAGGELSCELNPYVTFHRPTGN